MKMHNLYLPGLTEKMPIFRIFSKSALILATILLTMTSFLSAQQRARAHYTNPNTTRTEELRLLQQVDYEVQPISQAALHVIGSNEDTTVIMANPDMVRLKDDQKFAAMKTTESISPLIDEALIRKFDIKKDQGFVLPEVYYAKSKENDELLAFQILFINAGPMRFNKEKSVFQGTMQFLPVEISSSPNPGTAPKMLQDSLDIYVITPDSKEKITLTQLNWPLIDYTVQAYNPLDSVEVRVSTILNPLGYKQKLRVEPAIEISSGSIKIQGYGIQTTPIFISLKGTSSSSHIPFALKVSEGFLAKDTFNLNSSVIGKTDLRSGGTGNATVSVFNTSYVSNTIDIEYVFPWMFLLFSLGGGIIGSLVKVLMKKRPFTAKPLIIGALAGFIVALCYWALGLKILDISIDVSYFNEFAVLALSILGGYIGLPEFGKK
jgi:hypothetical protein